MIVLGCFSPPPLESNFVVDRGGDGQRRPSKPGGSERWSSGGKAGEARYFERHNERIARQCAEKAERDAKKNAESAGASSSSAGNTGASSSLSWRDGK